ncbi:MAG: Mu transposase C-terminal domain-containing protein [Thermoanaerobaculia bacterium]
MLPYVVRDPNTLAAYHTIQADHRQIDVPVRCDKGCEVCSTTHRRKGKKPRGHFPIWTVYYDIRSRRVLGSELSIDTPTSRTVLAVFYRVVDEYGVPCRLYIDNGADFRKAYGKRLRRKGMQQWDGPSEEALRAQFVQLGVEVTYAIPYNAQAKPIERMLRTFRHQFDEDFEAYRGQHGEKSELAQELLFRPDELPAISDMRYLLELQIEKYNATAHSGRAMDDRSPDEVFYDPEIRLPRRVPNAAFAYLAFEPLKGGRIVGRTGVREQGRWYRLSSLRQHLNYYGERVSVRINPNDERRAMLFDWRTGQVICEAVASTEDATYDTRDEITRRIIERVYGDGKELMRMANEYVAGSRERLIEYRAAKLEYLTQRSREITANRLRLAAQVEGMAPVLVGQFTTEPEYDLLTLQAVLDEDDARAKAEAAAEVARLCVVAPRRADIPAPAPRTKPRVLRTREIAERLGCTQVSYNEYKRGATPWPSEEMRLEAERLELLRDASSAEIEAALAEPPRYQRPPVAHHTGDATLKAIAAELGVAVGSLRRYRNGRRKWPAGLKERHDQLCAERREREASSTEGAPFRLVSAHQRVQQTSAPRHRGRDIGLIAEVQR